MSFWIGLKSALWLSFAEPRESLAFRHDRLVSRSGENVYRELRFGERMQIDSGGHGIQGPIQDFPSLAYIPGNNPQRMDEKPEKSALGYSLGYCQDRRDKMRDGLFSQLGMQMNFNCAACRLLPYIK